MKGFEVHKKEVHCFPLVENLNQLIGNKERKLCSKITWKVRTKLVGAKGDKICYQFTVLRPAKSIELPCYGKSKGLWAVPTSLYFKCECGAKFKIWMEPESQ